MEGTRFAIVCLTPDNLTSTWIHYETGALSKTKDAVIWTFLHGLTYSDVPPPLGKFQHTLAEKDDILRLLKTINNRLAELGAEPLKERLVEDNAALFWPQLERKLNAAEQLSDASHQEPERDVRAILNEILELVRSQDRKVISLQAAPLWSLKSIQGSLPPPTTLKFVFTPSKDNIAARSFLKRFCNRVTGEIVEIHSGADNFIAWVSLPHFGSDIIGNVIERIAEESSCGPSAWEFMETQIPTSMIL